MDRLNYAALSDAGGFRVLGKLFSNRASIGMLLRELDTEAGEVVALDGQTPTEFWSTVCHDIDNGRFTFGLDELIAHAHAHYPGSRQLAEIAGRGGGSGRDATRTNGSIKTVKVLCLSASPTDMTRLRLEVEHRVIQEVFAHRSTASVDTQVAVRPATRLRDVIPALLADNPSIVHFAGHGTSTGDLVFEHDTGIAAAVSPETLAEVFAAVTGVHCVVLNSCYTAGYAQSLLGPVDTVIGSIAPLHDDAATAFSTGFYGGLVAGREIQGAYDLGLAEMRLHSHRTADMRIAHRSGTG